MVCELYSLVAGAFDMVPLDAYMIATQELGEECNHLTLCKNGLMCVDEQHEKLSIKFRSRYGNSGTCRKEMIPLIKQVKEVSVIGAGPVGLLTALDWKHESPSSNVIVHDKREQENRNHFISLPMYTVKNFEDKSKKYNAIKMETGVRTWTNTMRMSDFVDLLEEECKAAGVDVRRGSQHEITGENEGDLNAQNEKGIVILADGANSEYGRLKMKTIEPRASDSEESPAPPKTYGAFLDFQISEDIPMRASLFHANIFRFHYFVNHETREGNIGMQLTENEMRIGSAEGPTFGRSAAWDQMEPYYQSLMEEVFEGMFRIEFGREFNVLEDITTSRFWKFNPSLTQADAVAAIETKKSHSVLHFAVGDVAMNVPFMSGLGITNGLRNARALLEKMKKETTADEYETEMRKLVSELNDGQPEKNVLEQAEWEKEYFTPFQKFSAECQKISNVLQLNQNNAKCKLYRECVTKKCEEAATKDIQHRLSADMRRLLSSNSTYPLIKYESNINDNSTDSASSNHLYFGIIFFALIGSILGIYLHKFLKRRPEMRAMRTSFDHLCERVGLMNHQHNV